MIKRRAVGLLISLGAALAMLPASAHGASSCNQAAAGIAMGAYQCGGQAQLSFQESTTTQKAESEAQAEQNAISSANNSASTEQSNEQSQHGSSSGCSAGCGGAGQVQVSGQTSTTTQTAESDAEAKQDATDANLPVNLATRGPITANGNNSGERDASNNAESSAGNEAQTRQSNRQRQEGGSSSCLTGCGAHVQAQRSVQESTTTQTAVSETQAAANNGTSSANNNAGTTQTNDQSQDGGSSSCSVGCGGNAQVQVSGQSSTTTQTAESEVQANGPSSRSAAEGNASAESNTTTQLIWQVQISECVARCAGLTQHQNAVQQNMTREALGESPPAAADTPAGGERSQATTSLTQIQLGCLAHCLGTTTSTAATGPQGARYLRILEEVLNRLPQEFLGAIAAALPGPSPAPAAQENAVAQISYQSQSASGSGSSQAQTAEQTNTTVQLYDPSSALIAGFQRAVGGQAAASEETVNQTEQGIWQLQIGCLFFCEETVQFQQAVQSNTPVQPIASAADAASTAATSAANITTQLVWQAQVGCLFWCINTTQQQIAPSGYTVMAFESHSPAAPPPSGPPLKKGSTPPGLVGTKPVLPAPAPGGSLSGRENSSPGPSGDASTPAPAAAVSVLDGTSLATVRSTTVVRQRRAAVRGTRAAVIPAGAGATPRVQQREVRAGLTAQRTGVRAGDGPRVSARPARQTPPVSEVGARIAAGSADEVGRNVGVAIALAAFVLSALSVSRVALRARRG